MIDVRADGAFAMDCVGVERAPVPMTINVTENEGSWRIGAAVVRVHELLDLAMREAHDTVVVAALETYSFGAPEDPLWAPSRIAAEHGVTCSVHPASPSVADEMPVLRRDHLPRLFTGDWLPPDLALAAESLELVVLGEFVPADAAKRGIGALA